MNQTGRNVLLAILAISPFRVSAQSKDELLNPGVWQIFGNTLSASQYPLEGRLSNFLWKDIETAPDVWNWTALDKELSERTKDGLPLIFMVYTKQDAPDWLFTTGSVPKVTETNSKGEVTGYAPYYKDPNYKIYFKRMIQKVHQHIETLASSVRNKLIGVQACFGNTGDYISYKGTVSSQYALSNDEFTNLFKEFSQYYYDEYKNTNPKIAVLSNPRNNGNTQTIWVVQNCPGGWLKNGSIGKGFQLNGERDKASWLYNILNTPQSGSYVRLRCEMKNGGVSGTWWKSAPYQNMFAVMCSGIHWGLDWTNQAKSELGEKNYGPAFAFFDKYAGQKDPLKATNAMCALKDALDASDETRFPAATYGTASKSNTTRYQNIANAFAPYGAKLEDAKTATLDEMDNIKAKGVNDVGWNIFPGNYEHFLHQLRANETSIGYWNVKSAEANSIYGKYARSFDIAKSKNALYFDVEDAFLGNTPLDGKYSVTIEVTYLDYGNGGFQLFYDSKNNPDNSSVQVTCGNTNTWKKTTVTLSDAYFGNRGSSTSDFSIRSTNSENVKFSVVEFSRPAGFNSLPASFVSVSKLSSGNQVLFEKETDIKNCGLVINPNPVIEKFSVQLKNNGDISSIAVYNQAGQLLLQKHTVGSKISIRRNEIAAIPGIYYLKVYSGKTIYNGKVIIL